MVDKKFLCIIYNLMRLGGARLLSKITIKAQILSILLISLFAFLSPLAASSQELTASRIKIDPYDGRKGNKGTWIGAWVMLQGVRIDGKSIGKSSVGFEFSGKLPRRSIFEFGVSSKRTFTDMPKHASERSHKHLGYRTWIGAKNGGSDAWNLYSKLNKTDKIIFKGICGLIADEKFTKKIMDTLGSKKPYSYEDYVDEEYSKYFSMSGRNKELSRIGQACNSRIGNKGDNFVAFKIGSSSTSSVAKNTNNNVQKLCGYPTNYTTNRRLNSSQLRMIQTGLARYGLYNGAIDGAFGRGSCAALKKFMNCQNKNKSKLDDGHIYKLSSSWIKPTISENACFRGIDAKVVVKNTCSMSEADIKIAQNRLTNVGIYNSSIDGKIGQGTTWAFTNFETILGEFADNKKACLSKEEIKWIGVLDWGLRNKAKCNDLNKKNELRLISADLKKLGFNTKDFSTGANQSTAEKIPEAEFRNIVKSIIDYEKSVDDGYFKVGAVKRDCRLIAFERNTVKELLAPKLTEFYTLSEAKHLMADLKTYLGSCENYFGAKLADLAAPVNNISDLDSWNDDLRKSFQKLADFVKEEKFSSGKTCEPGGLSNVEDFGSYHSAMVDSRRKAQDFAVKTIDDELNILKTAIQDFKVTNPLDSRSSSLSELISRIEKGLQSASDGVTVFSKLQVVKDIREKLGSLEIPFQSNEISLVDSKFLLNADQLKLANSLKELNEQLIAIGLAEEEASKSEEIAKVKESLASEERLRQEAATLFDDIREYYNLGNQMGLELAKFLNDAKGAELSDDWTVELTKNFEELLTYVNKFEDFKAFRVGRKEARSSREEEIKSVLASDINRVISEVSNWVQANPFSDNAGRLYELIDEFSNKAKDSDINSLETSLNSLLASVEDLSIKLPISELLERRGYKADGENKPLGGAQDVIIELSDAQQFIMDLKAFTDKNPDEFGLQLVRLYTAVVPIIQDNVWSDSMKEAFSSLKDFTTENEKFTSFRYALIDLREKEKQQLMASLQEKVACMLNTGEAFSKANLFADETVELLKIFEFAERLRNSKKTNDQLRLLLNLKNSYGDLQIEYECDLVLDFEILKLSGEEKTLIEEINGVNEAIRLAELEKDKAEREQERLEAEKAAEEEERKLKEAEEEDQRLKEQSKRAKQEYEKEVGATIAYSDFLFDDVTIFVESGYQFPVEFVTRFSQVRGLIGKDAWTQEQYYLFVEFENWLMTISEFSDFVKNRTQQMLVELNKELKSTIKDVETLSVDLTQWAAKNPFAERAVDVLAAVEEISVCANNSIFKINDRTEKVEIEALVTCAMDSVKSISRIIDEQQFCTPALNLGCISGSSEGENSTGKTATTKPPGAGTETTTASQSSVLVKYYVEKASNLQFLISDLQSYFETMNGNQTCLSDRKAILEIANLRQLVETSADESSKVKIGEFIDKFISPCDEVFNFLGSSIEKRTKDTRDLFNEKTEELQTLSRELEQWATKNPFDQRAENAIKLLEKSELLLSDQSLDYEEGFVLMRDLIVEIQTTGILSQKEPNTLEGTKGTTGSISEDWNSVSDFISARQKRFCQIVENSREELDIAMTTGNQLKQNLVLRNLDQQIEAIIPDGEFSDWVMQVQEVFATEEGNAAFKLEAQCNTTFGTGSANVENEKQVWFAPAKPGSRIFEQLLSVERGDFVLVNGRLITYQSEGITSSSSKFITQMGINSTFKRQTDTKPMLGINPDYFVEVNYLSKL